MTRTYHALPSEIARSVGNQWRMDDEPAHDEYSFANLAQQMPGLFLTTDMDLRITLAQGAGLAALKWRPHQLPGLTVGEFFRTDEADGPPVDAFRSALAGQAGSWEWAWGNRLFHGNVEPFFDAEGHPLGTIATALDITERQQAQEERLQAEIQVQEANKVRSLKTLAGGVAHNFNNLLSAVIGYTSLALMDVPVDSPIHALLVEIDAAAQCAADLAGQMLLFAQKTKKECAPINLSSLIESLLPQLEANAGKNIVLLHDLAKDLPAIAGNPCQLRQLVLNLFRNAAEAIAVEPGTIRLRTRTVHGDRQFFSSIDEDLPDGEYLWLQVSDSGCGMDEDTRARIFEPFFSTKFTGRGLGMATAQGIVREHQGAISVSSQPGLGSTIHVFLPVAFSV